MVDEVAESGELFDSGYGRAEAVLLAVCEDRGIESDLVPRIATGFCGGIARSGSLCGAVTASAMTKATWFFSLRVAKLMVRPAPKTRGVITRDIQEFIYIKKKAVCPQGPLIESSQSWERYLLRARHPSAQKQVRK